MKQCLDCQKSICDRAMRCKSCAGRAVKRKWSERAKQKREEQWKGKTWSPDTIFKAGHKFGVRFKKGQIPWNKDKNHSEESIQKMKEVKIGLYANEKHWNWKGGISSENNKIRNSFEYKEWRRKVLRKDDYICQICGKRGGKLQADHIKPFAYFSELRFAINNGRTLCGECHKKTDTFGNKAKNSSVEEYNLAMKELNQ